MAETRMGRGARDGKDVSVRTMGFKSIPVVVVVVVVVVAQSDQRKGRPSKAPPVPSFTPYPLPYPYPTTGRWFCPFNLCLIRFLLPVLITTPVHISFQSDSFFDIPHPLLSARSACVLISVSVFCPSPNLLKSDSIRAELYSGRTVR
jgi:hypothetical protein